MKTWYKIVASAGKGRPPVVSIMDDIGAWGITAAAFIRDVRALGDVPAIDVEISSNGGDMFAGLAMYNALRAHPAKINVRVMGIAASAGSLVAMAGDTIEMPANTFMMVHYPSTARFGNAEEFRELADVLDKFGDSLVNVYVARTGKSEEEVRALLADESYITADEALALGFCTVVTPEMKIAAEIDPDRLPAHVVEALSSLPVPYEAATDEAATDEAATDEAATDEAATDEAAAAAAAQAAFEGEVLAAEAATAQAAFLDGIMLAAAAHGLEEFAGTWALDDKLTSMEQVNAAVANAKSIRALCALAGKAEMFVPLLRSRATVEAARTALIDARAADDAATHTSQLKSEQNSKPSNSAQTTAVTTQTIWAARRSTN